jgi:hypothetical protein
MLQVRCARERRKLSSDADSAPPPERARSRPKRPHAAGHSACSLRAALRHGAMRLLGHVHAPHPHALICEHPPSSSPKQNSRTSARSRPANEHPPISSASMQVVFWSVRAAVRWATELQASLGRPPSAKTHSIAASGRMRGEWMLELGACAPKSTRVQGAVTLASVDGGCSQLLIRSLRRAGSSGSALRRRRSSQSRLTLSSPACSYLWAWPLVR